MSYIFAPGATSKSVEVQIVDDTGLPVTGLAAATFPAVYYWICGANAAVQISLSDLATITTAYSSGGLKEIDSTNLKGYYRLDVPNAVLTSAGEVKIGGEATNKRLICEVIKVLISLPDALPGAASGILIAGSNAATTFATLTVSGATTLAGNLLLSDGLTIASPSTTNRAGITVTGNGTGAGIKSTGGISGPGMLLVGGASANGDGLQITGSAGHGIYVSASAGNDGIHVLGNTSGHGLYLEAGSSGNGLRIAGGSSSGDGVSITTISGHGINVAATGASKHGVLIVGGDSGTSDGLKLTAGSGGVGFRLDTLTASGAVTLSSTLTLTGAVSATNASNDIRGVKLAATGLALVTAWTVDVTGSLSGSVGSVTGAVGSVTGNVGGNVVGSVGSVVAAIVLPTIPTDWITANGIAADAIGSSELAATAVTEIQTGLSTLDAAGVRTAVGLASANLDTQLAAIQADLPARITKNIALASFTFPMFDDSDHVTLLTGLTITATRSIDGAAFGACANSAAEIGTTGVYKIDLAAADLNGNVIALKFTATGADTQVITIVTQNT